MHPGGMPPGGMHPRPVQAPVTAAQGAWTQHFAVRQTSRDPKQTQNIVLLIVGIGGLVVLGLGMLLILLFASFQFNGVGVLIVLLSGIPLLGIVATVLLFDRWKPQPLVLLALCVLWGGVASVVLTFAFQIPTIYAAGAVGIDLSGDVVGAVVMAPIFEEIAKTVFLVAIVLLARRHFEGPLDGMMYGSLVGAGFAFTENLLYLGGAYAEAQTGGLIATFVVRCVMSPLLHSSFSALAGLSIGFAARRGTWWMTALMWIPGLICGMILHGIWNGTSTVLGSGLGGLAVMLGLSVVIAGGWWTTMVVLWHRETTTTRESLQRYAGAGWLTQEEAQMLGTWRGRRDGRRWARPGPARTHMKQMIRIAATLPAVRARVEANVGGAAEREYEVYLLKQLTIHRNGMLAAMGLAVR
jgi:RsiW-degrading membrane proteinase PrsW (M82 family)